MFPAPNIGSRKVELEGKDCQKYGRVDSEQTSSQSFHITALAYSLVPVTAPEDAAALLGVVLSESEFACLRQKDDLLLSKAQENLTQVEFFFMGTSSGELLALLLLLPDVLSLLGRGREDDTANAGVPFLVHRHSAGCSVTSISVEGSVVASSSSDRQVVISFFFPEPVSITRVIHPGSLSCMTLWSGNTFVSSSSISGLRSGIPTREITHVERKESDFRKQESSALYVFAGDHAATVRLFRVCVSSGEWFLTHVFVVSTNFCGSDGTPLRYLNIGRRSDVIATVSPPSVVRCIAVDGGGRMVVGMERGFAVWDLRELVWRGSDSDSSMWRDGEESSVHDLSLLAARLVGRHVFIKAPDALKAALERWHGSSQGPARSNTTADNFKVSTWKEKYRRRVTEGRQIGEVTHSMAAPREAQQDARIAFPRYLEEIFVTIVFSFHILRSEVMFPLSSIEPVVYPLSFSGTSGFGCVSLAVLGSGRRVATYHLDGAVRVWNWDVESKAYNPVLRAQTASCAAWLGGHVLALRSPDIFITCGMGGGLVQEWHVYDEPELLLRCWRSFGLSMSSSPAFSQRYGHDSSIEGKPSNAARGVRCAAAFPLFLALFLVADGDTAIQCFTIKEIHSCEPPANYWYNGLKTVRVSTNVRSNSL